MHNAPHSTNYSTLPVAVIGGGFTGTLTAIHLSRRIQDTPIILFEEKGDAGPGLAYGISDPHACLNIPAGKMSAFAERPEHFLEYARREYCAGSKAGDFLPRHVFGAYLRACLAEAREANPLLRVDTRRVVDVTGIDGHAAELTLKDQSTVKAAKVVLATGNQGSAFAASIWAAHAVATQARDAAAVVEDGQDVVIVGSGLTMIDTFSTPPDLPATSARSNTHSFKTFSAAVFSRRMPIALARKPRLTTTPSAAVGRPRIGSTSLVQCSALATSKLPPSMNSVSMRRLLPNASPPPSTRPKTLSRRNRAGLEEKMI